MAHRLLIPLWFLGLILTLVLIVMSVSKLLLFAIENALNRTIFFASN